MIKPIRTFILLAYVLVLIGLFSFLPGKIILSESVEIKIPQLSRLFVPQETQYKDISDIQDQFQAENDASQPKEEVKDSVKVDSSLSKKPKPFVPDSLRLNEDLRIQYPANQDSVLYGFFRALRGLQNNSSLVRVVHFGDSQLEGDRITGFLRQKFQSVFGGCGVGLLNMVDKLHTKYTIQQFTSDPWVQHPMYGPKGRYEKSKYFGILGDYYTFPLPDPPEWTKVGIQIQASPTAHPLQKKAERLKIMYRNPQAPLELGIQEGSHEVVREKMEIHENFSIFEYQLRQPFERIALSFATGQTSPEVYGVSLDCPTGITFDNVPLRGSSGVEFARIDPSHLRRQFKKLGVKFLILQFGVNIVPNPLPDYTFYENMFYNQLKFLKNIDPNISILVVGVSDMSYNAEGVYKSYPNIEKIRNAQRNAAFKAHCAFWDLYEAMGGENSMPSWVFAKPQALANKDFTHFTSAGASLVSEMLYKAILTEYDRFNELFY